MPTWKRIFVKAMGIGAGFALMLGLIFGGIVWYESRPKPLKPWTDNRLVVTRDYFWLTGKDKKVQVNYILENRSDEDFKVSSKDELEYEALYKRQQASGSLTKEAFELDYPIFVPAHSRRELQVMMNLTYPDLGDAPPQGSHEQNEVFSQRVAKRLSEDMPNIIGLQLRVPSERAVIRLPLRDE